jgi:hypothetical protein
MNNTPKSKRLDKIELHLTPKQWAIRLADEMRRYPSQEEFMKAIAKSICWQSPFAMPFYALAAQAQERWPHRNQEHIWLAFELNCKLRTEFQALKALINDVNTAIEIKAQRNRHKAAQQLYKLQTLILQDAFAHTGVAETMSASPGSPARLRLISLLEDWADDSAMLLTEATAHKAAVQTVQEKYFESHPILHKDTETAFEMTIRIVRDAIALFNEYRKVMADSSIQKSDQEQLKAGMVDAMLFEFESSLPIDIEAIEKRAEMFVHSIVKRWVMNAKFTGTADILQETGKHEDFIWQQVRKELGLES